MEPVGQMKRQHFVLIHGSGHGAWCWYKLKAILESAGHFVTALDMAASGIDTSEVDGLTDFDDYNTPLYHFMDSLDSQEKVILVGHNFGGFNVAVAADEFPGRVSAAIFVAAFLPDTKHSPFYPLEKYGEFTPAETWLDTEFRSSGDPKKPRTTITFGLRFLYRKLYYRSSIQDIVLAELLVRPTSIFGHDLPKEKPLSKQCYGRVKRAYIKCRDDRVMPVEFESWMVQNAGVSIVKEIQYADHMAMISSPMELSLALLQVVRALSLD